MSSVKVQTKIRDTGSCHIADMPPPSSKYPGMIRVELAINISSQRVDESGGGYESDSDDEPTPHQFTDHDQIQVVICIENPPLNAQPATLWEVCDANGIELEHAIKKVLMCDDFDCMTGDKRKDAIAKMGAVPIDLRLNSVFYENECRILNPGGFVLPPGFSGSFGMNFVHFERVVRKPSAKRPRIE